MGKLRRTDNLAARWWRSIVRMVVDRTEGLAGVEFALLSVVLICMAGGALELGMGFYRKMQVYDASQAGAQYVIKKGYSSADSVSSAVTSATALSGITASSAQSCGCPTTSGITSATCGNACADGTLAATYVTVTAQYTHTPIMNLTSLGLPASILFTANSKVRIK